MQPYSLTPENLRAELCLRGCPTSKRWILECVRKGLLPALSERGKGQGRGKRYFWGDPAIVEQAVAIFILRDLKYPTSVLRLSIWLMGFSCCVEDVRLAWLSCIDRLLVRNKQKVMFVEKRRGLPFPDAEDRASELSHPIAKQLSKSFRLNWKIIEPAVLETYSLILAEDITFDAESLEHVITVIAGVTGLSNPNFDEQELESILEFLQSLALRSVFLSAKHSTNDELELARKQWLQLVELLGLAFPILNDEIGGLSFSKFLTARSCAACLSPLLSLIRSGKRRELNITLEIISDFVRNHPVPQSLPEALNKLGSDHGWRTSLASLLNDLSSLWRHQGFPFLPGNPTGPPSKKM
jgi:hypothetical protein